MIVSFYSYKGGVGRTQLCANIAAYFYYQKEKRVLLWDWDWEAPGLHYFFNKTNEDIIKKGTLELFEDYLIYMRKNATANSNKEISKRVTPDELTFISEDNIINLINAPQKKGCIDLLPAGNYSTNFSGRANNFDWYDFYTMKDGANYIELLKIKLKDLDYDYILIDSRTGISDYSGICNIQLPEINVIVIAATMQNFEGCKTIIKKIEDSEYLKITNHEPLILPILSRLDESSEKYSEWEQRFAEYFSPLIQHLDKNLAPEYLPEVFKDVYYNDTFLPYRAAISAGENIFANDKSITKSHFGWPFLNIADLIEELNLKKGTEFYKKIDETSWYRYANSAERSNDNKKAAIAYNQIGIKQKDTAEQIDFFEKANRLDPENKEVQNNLVKAFANQKNYKTNTSYISEITETLVANEKLQLTLESKEPYQRKYKLLRQIAVYAFVPFFILIGVGVGLYTGRSKDQSNGLTNQKGSLKKDLAILKKDSFFIDPVSNGSPYFDSIRNIKKPIGLDISNKNQIYDLSKTKNYGISFMLIKATEGKTYQDPSFEINWLAIQKTKILRGAYHYFTINNDAKPDEQAENYIENVKLQDGDLPPILNLYAYEGNYKSASGPLIKNNLRIYLDRISIHYGAKPIVFLTGSFAKYFLSGSDLSNCYLWKNQSNQNLYQPDQTPGWKNWTFWQFSTKEVFDGILTASHKNNENIDANQFNGNNQDLLEITLKTSPGRSAVMVADHFLTDPNVLFQITNIDGAHVSYNNTTFSANFFKHIKFNWDVELINRCFASLRTPALYGKGYNELFSLLKGMNYIVNGKSFIKIGDIAFYDFQEKKGIQACSLVYNYDETYVYALEAYDEKSQLKVRTTKRFIADVYAFAEIGQ